MKGIEHFGKEREKDWNSSILLFFIAITFFVLLSSTVRVDNGTVNLTVYGQKSRESSSKKSISSTRNQSNLILLFRKVFHTFQLIYKEIKINVNPERNAIYFDPLWLDQE